ncbi:MAG: hypothetical protein Fur0021_01200 [Candidatus Promineifilaceae bacterium]
MSLLLSLRSWQRLLLAAVLLVLFALVWGGRQRLAAQETPPLAQRQRELWQQRQSKPPIVKEPLAFTPCVDGYAGTFPCHNVDLLAFMPISQIGGGNGNDSWGWTDPDTGKEYVLMGRTNGLAFVDISDPINPIYLGNLPTATVTSIWRDVKTYSHYAYVVADNAGMHGIQVFDLRQLRDVTNPPVTFTESGHYSGITSAHNIAIDPNRPYAYAVGSNMCNGGLHIVSLADPLHPGPGTCHSAAYTHDTQCVVYHGPDEAHQGKDICFDADGNSNRFAIVDVSNKNAPDDLARVTYGNASYPHQGWLTENHRYFLLDDEGDEIAYGFNTRTYIWDVADLDNPVLIGVYTGPVASIDHNLYVRDYYAFEANYSSGLRIVDITHVADANLTEVAYFDTLPANNSPSYDGAWSTYPFFASRVVVISDETGLYLVRPHLPLEYDASLTDSAAIALPGETVVHTFTLHNLRASNSYELSLDGGQWPAFLLSPTRITVPTDDTAEIRVLAQVPGGLTSGVVLTDTFTLTATSILSPELSVTGTGVTTVEATPGVSVTPALSSRAAQPGEVVTHTFTVVNSGDYPDTFAIIIQGSIWNTQADAGSLTLDAGAAVDLEVAVSIPDEPIYAVPIASDSFTLTLTSSLDGAVWAQASGVTTANVEPGVTLDPPQMWLSGNAGSLVTHTLTLANTGNYTDTFTLQLAGYAWPTTLQPTSVTLGAGATTAVDVVVSIPLEPTAASDSFMLTAVSHLDSSVTVQAAGVTELPVAALSLSGETSQSGFLGQTLWYTLTVTNLGTDADSFHIHLSDSAWPTTATPDHLPNVPAQSSATFTVSVLVGSGLSDSVTVTVVSTLNPELSASLTLTTTTHALFLPLVNAP